MMRITRRLAILCLGGSAFVFGNCAGNVQTAARDGALDAWEGFVSDTVLGFLEGLIAQPGDEG